MAIPWLRVSSPLFQKSRRSQNSKKQWRNSKETSKFEMVCSWRAPGFQISGFFLISTFILRMSLMSGPEQDHLLISAFDLDAVSLDARIVFESLVDDTAVERIERFKFDDIAPAPDFFSGFFCFLDE